MRVKTVEYYSYIIPSMINILATNRVCVEKSFQNTLENITSLAKFLNQPLDDATCSAISEAVQFKGLKEYMRDLGKSLGIEEMATAFFRKGKISRLEIIRKSNTRIFTYTAAATIPQPPPAAAASSSSTTTTTTTTTTTKVLLLLLIIIIMILVTYIISGKIGDWKTHFTVEENEAFDKLLAEKMAGVDLHLQFKASPVEERKSSEVNGVTENLE